ncbi:MAG: methyltransferase domain-containing protein [Sulfuricella sp.]
MSLALGCVAENTPKYLGQAVRLVQSVRWFGGALNEAELYVCVVEGIRQDFREELERYDARIRVVPRFSTKHPQSNKLRFLELPDLARHDQVLLLDCDTIVVRDPLPHLFRAEFTAKIADAPTVPLDTFRQLFSAFGLPMPETSQRCTVRGEPTIPYFNAGVLAFSRRAMDNLVPKWIKLNERLIASMELLEGHENFCEQASLSLAIAAIGIPFEVVGNAFNFPMHFDDPATATGLADIDPFIVHYHWLADPSGYILPSAYPAVNRRIAEFNARLRKERESRFDNRLFWNQRYAENPELGSGIGSRGEARDYKRRLLADVAARWQPRSILDVGCGDLDVGSALPAEGYTGLDFSEVVVAANREKYQDRIFLAGDFLEMESAPMDMVVCLDVLIHLASPDDYRNFVHKLVRSMRKVGIVAGDEVDPALDSIVFYHEPLSRTLTEAGVTNIRKIGAYRHVTIFEFTPPPPKRRNALIVLGMHRSGTSALTGVLSMLGADPGPLLMPGQDGVNPKGFWEHTEIVALHEGLLAALDSSWQDERPLPDNWWQLPLVSPFRAALKEILQRDFSQSPVWILKDPRLCRLLPLWLEILRDLGATPQFVISLRNPFEVARSLDRRDRLPEARSCLLWLEHLLETERWTRGHPRVVVTYDQLLADWGATSRLIAEGLSLPFQTDDPVAAARIENFLEPSLRHHHAVKGALSDNRLSQLAAEAYQIAVSAPANQLTDTLAPIAKEVGKISRLVDPWATQLHALDRSARALAGQNTCLEQSNADLLSEVKRVKSTISWQVTKPLRLLAFLGRGFAGLFGNWYERKNGTSPSPAWGGKVSRPVTSKQALQLMNQICPVCFENIATPFGDEQWFFFGKSYRLTRCPSCGSAFTTPLPDDATLQRIYHSSFDYRWYRDHFPAKLKDSRMRLDEYKGLLGPRVLDFGGGVGYFSQAAREAGYQSVTYDPFTSAVPAEKGAWDTVVALHVLEHANDLDRTCEQLKELLAPGGRVILAVPNFSGRGYREQGMRWVWAQPPLIHIFHFTAAGLAALLSRHGFSDIQVSYHERWDANLYCDVEHAEQFRKWDAAWGIRPFKAFPPYRRLIAYLNSRRRFRGREESLRNYDRTSDISAELQITAVLERP